MNAAVNREKKTKDPEEWYHAPMRTGAAHRLDLESQNPTPESFLEEIHAIINSGTLRGAREVAERGLALYPDHPELKRAHYALRPFEVRVNPDLKIDDPRPNYEWLKKHSDEYRGKWVGLDAGELVAATDTLDEVLKALEGHSFRSTLVHHIL
jgi:Family of unknown function (DUF5678)